LRLRHLVIPWS